MIENSNSNSTGTRRNSTSKIKKDNKNSLDSTKNSKKPAVIAAPSTGHTKVKKDNKNSLDSTNDQSTSITSVDLDKITNTKKENKEKEQLSYFEKQVLKELKGIKKASKNILKTIKKFNV
ncbi:MAG: hypothetical protein AB7V56_10450 [Candidatus Nitrosocosmicus sp.]